jgi:hypothetical protein
MAQVFSRRWLFAIFVLPVSLFIGLIVSTAGAAAWPQVTGLATPLICRGRVEHVSERWTVPPNTRGVSRTIYCVQRDGTREDITSGALVAAFIVYSALAFALLALLVGWLHRGRPQAFNPPRQPGTGDPGFAGTPDKPADADIGPSDRS